MSVECPHFETSLRPLAAADLHQLINVQQCDVCGNNARHLWLCLYPDCYMLGCADNNAEGEEDHSFEHQRSNKDHHIQLNIKSRRAWCFGCAKEVHISRTIIGSVGSETFGKALKPRSTDQFIPQSAMNDFDVEKRLRHDRRHVGGRVGLANLGNTCYMNSALQCLSNVPALTEFFFRCASLVNSPTGEVRGREGANLSKAYLGLVTDLWKTLNREDGHYIAPTKVSLAIKTAQPMFRGFHQHDAQEFLRCFLDQMHEELMEPTHEFAAADEEELESVSEVESNNDDAKSCLSDDQGDDPEYETADSGVSESSQDGSGRKRKRAPSLLSCSEETRILLGDSGDADPSESCASDAEHIENGSSPGSTSPGSKKLATLKTSPALSTFNLHKRKQKTYRSIISDIFDGKLVSSVQCLTCDRVSMTTETFQDLSLPIPSQEMLSSLRSQIQGGKGPTGASSGLTNDGWISWIFSWLYGFLYGPTITLEDCLAYFFSADELKGDNMYSCEKCKKLRNGLKYSKVTVLPDVLSIHLKRFRHEFAFSSKVSTKVVFPLVDLDMSPWLHSESISKESTYELIGVICHHGTAGGGHYTSYALNHLDNLWYEFDDSSVTQVEDIAVMNAEAYVLFYRKVNDKVDPVRSELQRLLAEAQIHPGLMQFYVSKQWFNKFENFAEPGPIDNSDFLCRHGGVLPQKSEYVYDLCLAFPQSIWELLQSQFGGGPPCTRLFECSQCRTDYDALVKQKSFELEEFKRLHAEFKETSQSVIYCISIFWFKQWEGFVTDRIRDAPGAIDNKAIVSTVVTRSQSGNPLNMQILRPTSDYVQVSQDMWLLLHSIYGGGPEVIRRPNGSSQVTAVRVPSLPAITSRLRAKSLSENSSGIGPSPTSSVLQINN